MSRGGFARRLLASFVPAALLVPWGCTSPKSGDDRAPVDAGVDAAPTDARVIDASDATDALPSCEPRLSTGASVFVTDSTNTLFAFDSSGKAMGRVAAAGPTANLAGAGITLTSANVYVTITSANTVREFDLALSPQTLLDGAFEGLSLPRGIAWDCRNEELFVTNGLKGAVEPLGVFDLSGTLVRVNGGLPNSYGPAGIAYDPDDGTLWIANYVGGPSSIYGVAEYSVTAAAVGSFDYVKQFVSPEDHQEPYAIAVCPKAAVGGSTLVVVGFIDDDSGLGKGGAVQAYSIEGVRHGASYSFTKPYSLSCNSSGLVYVADQAGLFIIDIPRGTKVVSGAFPGLTPPIYGVVAGD
jgi:DNA-binding beta-propeller fold protein YncE